MLVDRQTLQGMLLHEQDKVAEMQSRVMLYMLATIQQLCAINYAELFSQDKCYYIVNFFS